MADLVDRIVFIVLLFSGLNVAWHAHSVTVVIVSPIAALF